MANSSVKPDGAKVRSLRIGHGLSSEKLAEKARCSVRSIQNAESGRNIHVPTLAKIAKALGVEPREIIQGTEEPVGTARAEIVIETNLETMNFAELNAFVELLSRMLPEAGKITIKDVRSGSMIVTLEMSEVDAKALEALFPEFHERAREVIRDKAEGASRSAGYMDQLREGIYVKDGKYYTSMDTMNGESYYLAYLTDMLKLAEGVRSLTVLPAVESSGAEWKPELPVKAEWEISAEILAMVGFPTDSDSEA